MGINHREKHHLLHMNSMNYKASFIETEILAGHLGKTDEGKEILSLFQSGRDSFKKAMDLRIGMLETDDKKWLERNSLLMDCAMQYKKDAARILAKFEEEDRRIRAQVIAELGPDPLYTLSEHAMERCKGCDGSPRQAPGGCPLHDALVQFGVPAMDEEDPRCQYINDVPSTYHPVALLNQELMEEKAALLERVRELEKRCKDAENQNDLHQRTQAELEQKVLDLERQAEVDRQTIERIASEAADAALELQEVRSEVAQQTEVIASLQREREVLEGEVGRQRALAERGRKIEGVVGVILEGFDLLREVTLPESPHVAPDVKLA